MGEGAAFSASRSRLVFDGHERKQASIEVEDGYVSGALDGCGYRIQPSEDGDAGLRCSSRPLEFMSAAARHPHLPSAWGTFALIAVICI